MHRKKEVARVINGREHQRLVSNETSGITTPKRQSSSFEDSRHNSKHLFRICKPKKYPDRSIRCLDCLVPGWGNRLHPVA
ncbi:hypothetical protein DPMN_081624, partial [Dreissena polymorpha]